MSPDNKIALSVLAHPDDAEFMCAGTLALLHQKGWEIHIATMTAGDCGSMELDREKISSIRRAEAADSAKMLDGTYHCLECDDVFVMYDRPTILKVTTLLRQVKPAVVFTASPSDYMADHETASKLTQTACFVAGMKNIDTSPTERISYIPHLYYVDPIEGKDILGKKNTADILVDIGSVMQTKEKMLCCHKSQRDWLLEHHGIDEYVNILKNHGKHNGSMIGKSFAEGFRQHLGHPFPQDNILKSELNDLVYTKSL
ncbi:MAG: PIG-L deacetylase family protein [Planctomycetota bacterium]|jgi:LmbE family N-acetylglucosaminyl deacetylase